MLLELDVYRRVAAHAWGTAHGTPLLGCCQKWNDRATRESMEIPLVRLAIRSHFVVGSRLLLPDGRISGER